MTSVRRRRRLSAGVAVTVISLAAVLVACSGTTGGIALPAGAPAVGTSGAATSGAASHVITEPTSPPGGQTSGVQASTGGQSSVNASQTDTGGQPSGSPAVTGTAPVPPGLDKYYTQQLQWGACAAYATTPDDAQAYQNPALACARLTVPLDYAKPDGPTVTVGVLRKQATGSDRIGSVLFDPGGPGASGMSIVATIAQYNADPDLNARFDLVGFDPRGVGSSTPTINCETDAQRDADRAANWPGFTTSSTQAQVDAANNRTKAYVQGCLDSSGTRTISGKDFLASVGTVTVAKDLDVLRAVLGDQKLTYVGWSYGTSIGTQYAEQFPGNVRALILDGAVNPNQNTATSAVDQTTGFQKAFEAFAADCVKRQGCALGTDAARATATFQQLVRPLMAKPVQLSDGRALSYLDAVTGVSQAMYSDSLWPDLRQALSDLAKGQGGPLMALADEYEQRDSSGRYAPLLDAFNAIRCMDNDRITDPAAQTELNKKLLAAAPFEDNGQPAAAIFDVCTYWPVAPTMTPHVPDPKGLPTVLVISTTNDPATPYQDGVDLAKYLGARLLTVEGTRHTAYMLSGIGCADQIGNDYLIDLKLPDEGAKC
jgi:pimeloyl-ACP methyl ester carboxylesterase